MSTPIYSGGPAFPFSFEEVDRGESRLIAYYGMTLRDYFAAAALAGMFADKNRNLANENHVARDAYLFADAMLAAQEGKQ